MRAHDEPHTVVDALHIPSHLILTIVFQVRHSHFRKDKKALKIKKFAHESRIKPRSK